MSYAEGGHHTMAGCGLGYLLMSSSDEGKGTQIPGRYDQWDLPGVRRSGSRRAPRVARKTAP